MLPSKVRKSKGKPSVQEMLPSRHAVSTIVGGSPLARSMNQYAKLTPSGAGAPQTYPAIIQEGEEGASLGPDGQSP